MAAEQKPREWWIRKYLWVYDRPNSPPGNQMVHTITGPDAGDPTTDVHVIEFAAYEQACKERDSLEDQLQWSLKNEEMYKRELAEARSGDCDIPAVKHMRWELNAERARSAKLLEALERISKSPEWKFEATSGDQLFGTYSFATISVALEALAQFRGAK